MKIKSVKVSSLSSDPANARKHDSRNIETIVASLKRFGQQKPIVVDSSGVVRAGNGTLEAAKQLGWETIHVTVSDLQGPDMAAYAIADNRTSELAEWDDDVLAATLESLQSDGMLDCAGFSDDDLAELLKDIELNGDGTTGEVTEDEVPEPPADPITKPGDLWQLGEHRLLCGDSTNAEDVSRLMNGEKASMVFTDPPYGVSYQSNMRTKTAKFDVIDNDDKFLAEWVPLLSDASCGFVFVWTSWKVVREWIDITKGIGELSNVIVWDKGGGGIGDLKKTFVTDFEIALVFHRGAELTGKRIGSVWSVGKDAASEYAHATQKPVALPAMAMESTTNRGSLVLDLFLGSGTTLIAAEQLGRKCYAMELSPAYCDVAVQRWENLTGQKATCQSATHE